MWRTFSETLRVLLFIFPEKITFWYMPPLDAR